MWVMTKSKWQTNIIEIVVFSSRTDTLLAVHSTLPAGLGAFGVDCPQENRFELCHPRVGKEEGRVIVRNCGGRGNKCMVPLFGKIVKEGWSNFGGRPGNLVHSWATKKNSGQESDFWFSWTRFPRKFLKSLPKRDPSMKFFDEFLTTQTTQTKKKGRKGKGSDF